MTKKRNKAQIALDREKARRLTCLSQYRNLDSDRERVLFLHDTYNVPQTDIIAITNLHESTVYRWITRRNTKDLPGRRGYLSPESERILFEEIIPTRHKQHKSMTTQEVIDEVGPSICIKC